MSYVVFFAKSTHFVEFEWAPGTKYSFSGILQFVHRSDETLRRAGFTLHIFY